MCVRKTKEQFIKEAISVHGGKYDYSLVEYKNSSTRVDIICHSHGIFTQTPTKHILGRGCRKCFNDRIPFIKGMTTEQFISKAKDVHGDLYTYEYVDYEKSTDKVAVVCRKHGVFYQRAGHHLSGHGCGLCRDDVNSIKASEINVGWGSTSWGMAAERSKYFDSFKVYIIKCYNDNEEFYKIGRTFTTTKHRFRGNRLMPYNYEIIKEIIFDNPKSAHRKETELKRLHKKFKYSPTIKFQGMYECFTTIELQKIL